MTPISSSVPAGIGESLFIPRTFSAESGGAVEGASFTRMLMESVNQVTTLESQAQLSISDHLAGGDITQVETALALREADLALRLMVQVRNKVVDAWNELKNMQV